MEIDDIAAFLAATAPFGKMDKAARATLAESISVRYEKRGTAILSVGADNKYLYIVRSGAVELNELGDSLSARLGEGCCFAYPSLLRDGKIRNAVTAIEDTLLYLVPADIFHDLRDRYPAIGHFFSTAEADRLRMAVAAANNNVLFDGQQKLETLLQRSAVTCPVGTQLQDAARLMMRESVSSLLITEGSRLVGIVTDRDFRSRAVAEARPPETPIEQVMTINPITISAQKSVLDALLLMSERNLHHLPVVDAKGNPLGLVSANDVLAAQAVGAVPLAKAVRKATRADDIAKILERLPGMAARLVGSGVDGGPVASQIASISTAVHRRIIQLAEAELGPPPIPYCFLVFGSLARRDQTLKTDQDNGLLLSDTYDPTVHDAYFKALAETVCDNLNRCGFEFCKGGIMATNPKWRQSLKGWKRIFERWIAAPEPKALMHASIFFDNAALWGAGDLRDNLMQHVLPLAGANKLFLAHMVENALSAKVPIGFFRRFVLTHDENHVDRLDIKKNGLVPLVDIIRAYALAHAVNVPGFEERVKALENTGAIAEADLREMTDAWHFLMTVRLAHQVRQTRRGERPDNLIAPGHLSTFEREHLRAAFSLIKTHQGGLSRALAGGFY